MFGFMAQSCMSDVNDASSGGNWEKNLVIDFTKEDVQFVNEQAGFHESQSGILDFKLERNPKYYEERRIYGIETTYKFHDNLEIQDSLGVLNYIKLKIDGLDPNTRYIGRVEVRLNSKLHEEMNSGRYDNYNEDDSIAVMLKAGLLEFEPEVLLGESKFYETNFDLGNTLFEITNDSQPIGKLRFPNDLLAFLPYIGLTHEDIDVKSDADGNIWLWVGTHTNTPVFHGLLYSQANVYLKTSY